MKKIFSFIFITLMCISLNSCAIYAMCDDYCDDYDRICHNCKLTQKRCYCNYKPDLNIRRNDNRFYYNTPRTVTYIGNIYDSNKPNPKPHIHHHKHHPKPTPRPHSHRPHNSRDKHKHDKRK
jgi:hypothetical protein